MNTTKHEQRCTHVAALVYYMGEAFNLAYQETRLAIRLSLSVLDKGNSAATAYEAGAHAIRTIASTHSPAANPQLD